MSDYRPRPATVAGPSAQPSVIMDTLMDLIDQSSQYYRIKRSHRKGISENLGLSSFREETTDDTNKLDTWEGFYNPRTNNDRRSFGP